MYVCWVTGIFKLPIDILANKGDGVKLNIMTRESRVPVQLGVTLTCTVIDDDGISRDADTGWAVTEPQLAPPCTVIE